MHPLRVTVAVRWPTPLKRTIPSLGVKTKRATPRAFVRASAVTPAPRAWHQELVGRLGFALRLYLRDVPTFHLFTAPADISWGPDILVQPDLLVVPIAEARTMDWAQLKGLVFTIEVLSPSTARYDRFTKRRLYQSVGVPLYWIVDPDTRSVEVWTPDALFPRVAMERVEWVAPGSAAAFAVELAELFRPV